MVVKPLKTRPEAIGPIALGSSMKSKVSIIGLAILLLTFTILPGILLSAETVIVQHVGRISASLRAAPLSDIRPFDYILIIVMENENFNQISGSSSAPYLNQLAYNYSLATQYSACDHPSLPNYMCLTGGNNYFSGTNCSPVGSCTTGNSSIVDRIESAGLTWRAYMEDMPAPCYKSGFGNYTFLTNPFIFYQSIGSNSTRCASHVVPANSGGKGLPDDNLINALGSTSTASNYMWLTPNLCNNMHNCSISKGDNYLSKLVPSILTSYIFRTQRAALLVTFDEGLGLYPTDYVYTIWAGPDLKTHYSSSIQYSHYSLPATIESAWGLPPLTSKDEGSPSMMEFFPSPTLPPAPLRANFTISPSNPNAGLVVNFSASATGGAQPYSYSWSFGDSSVGVGQSIGYSYKNIGNYTAILTVSDASAQSVSIFRAVSVDADLSPTGTCQHCTNATLPRTIGLFISFSVGVGLPLVLSTVVSRRHSRLSRRTMRDQDTVRA